MKMCGVLNSPEHFPSLTWAGGLTFELESVIKITSKRET